MSSNVRNPTHDVQIGAQTARQFVSFGRVRLHMAGIRYILADMSSKVERIASKVRGVAAEHRFTQQRIADTLDISRTSVTERYQGRVPFTAPEILTLAEEMNEPVARFFPVPARAIDTHTSPEDAADESGARLLDTTGASGAGE